MACRVAKALKNLKKAFSSKKKDKTDKKEEAKKAVEAPTKPEETDGEPVSTVNECYWKLYILNVRKWKN